MSLLEYFFSPARERRLRERSCPSSPSPPPAAWWRCRGRWSAAAASSDEWWTRQSALTLGLHQFPMSNTKSWCKKYFRYLFSLIFLGIQVSTAPISCDTLYLTEKASCRVTTNVCTSLYQSYSVQPIQMYRFPFSTLQAKKVGPIIRKLAFTLNPADTRWHRFVESCTYLVAERLGRDESHLLDDPLK